MCILFFTFSSIISYYKIVNIVPMPCSGSLFVICFIHSSVYIVMDFHGVYILMDFHGGSNPKLIIYPSLSLPLVTRSLISVSVNLFCFVNDFICMFFFLDSAYKQYHSMSSSVKLTLLSMIISRSI